MPLKQMLEQELIRLGARPGDTPELVVDLPPGRLLCQLTAIDALACSFQRLAWETPQLANATSATLTQLCDRLAKQLNYLLEPLRALEVDEESCTVQMRSQPPQQGDDGTCYYELLARKGGEVSLVRYCKPKQQPRVITPATVTREVFVRLAGDLSQSVK